MNLNIKTQNNEFNQQERDAIKKARNDAKKDLEIRIEEIREEINNLQIEEKNFRHQKENIVNEISNTTIGNKRKELLNQKTTSEKKF